MKKLIDRLEARALASPGDPSEGIRKFEIKTGMRLPAELTALLKEVGSAVVFDRGARFVPSKYSGRENVEGYLQLEVLYGGSLGSNGLDDRNSMLKDQLPVGLLAIGEAPGGDQICLQRSSSKVLFWKHDVGTSESITEIARDMASFLDSLEPDTEDGTAPRREIVEGESFLDF